MTHSLRTLRWAAALSLLALAATALAQQNPARPAVPRGGLLGADQQRKEQQQTQQQQQPQRVTANRLATEGAGLNNNDQTIANWLAIGNQAEITVSQNAAKHLEHKDVRKFAEMLAKDHEQLQQQLQRFGAAPVRFTERNDNRDQAQTRTALQQGQPANQAGRPLNFLEVNREIAQQCVNNAQKELSDKEGTERDQCFVGMQIAAHNEMIHTGRVLRDYASPELQAVIDKAVEGSESHLDQAKHLIKSLTSGKNADSDDDRSEK